MSMNGEIRAAASDGDGWNSRKGDVLVYSTGEYW
jgi:hypothetical protein